MAATKISDIIVPDVFDPYVTEKTAELTELFLGGIINHDPQFDELASSGGTILQMPFFTDLTGADEVLADDGSLTAGAIGTGKDQARMHLRGRAWGVNDLAKALSGEDPMRAIADLVSTYWARRFQDVLIASLKGCFLDDAGDDDDMSVDISQAEGSTADATNWIGPAGVIAAAGTLGDAAGKLTAIAMHSVCYQRLQLLEVIIYERPAGTNIKIPYYLGYRVLVDDNMPVVAGGTDGFVYTSYLFGEGAFGFGQGSAPVPSETDRDSLAGEDYLITRNHYIMHPRGYAWVETTVTGESPTNVEAALAVNWNRVYTRKNVRFAQLKTNG